MLSEQPPLGDSLDEWWEMWGGMPDVVGKDLEEVTRGILESPMR